MPNTMHTTTTTTTTIAIAYWFSMLGNHPQSKIFSRPPPPKKKERRRSVVATQKGTVRGGPNGKRHVEIHVRLDTNWLSSVHIRQTSGRSPSLLMEGAEEALGLVQPLSYLLESPQLSSFSLGETWLPATTACARRPPRFRPKWNACIRV